MHLILTGATGLVGSAVLDAMLHSQTVTKVSILSRRPVPMVEQANNPKVNVIIHKDFSDYGSEVLDKLQGANGVVWALGISQSKVSESEYVRITKDYAVAAANAFSKLASQDSPLRFIYVSGDGATQDPGRFSQTFSRVKGETELALAELRAKSPGLQAESVRPSYVDASAHAAIQPYIPDPGWLYRWGACVIGPPIRIAARSFHSPTQPLGQFLMDMAMGKYDGQLDTGAKDIGTLNGGLRIVENSAFRRMAGVL